MLYLHTLVCAVNLKFNIQVETYPKQIRFLIKKNTEKAGLYPDRLIVYFDGLQTQ